MSKKREDFDELDFLAESVFDFCDSYRADNVGKDGSPGNPRKISCEYKDLMNQPMRFYRSIAKWHLQNK